MENEKKISDGFFSLLENIEHSSSNSHSKRGKNNEKGRHTANERQRKTNRNPTREGFGRKGEERGERHDYASRGSTEEHISRGRGRRGSANTFREKQNFYQNIRTDAQITEPENKDPGFAHDSAGSSKPQNSTKRVMGYKFLESLLNQDSSYLLTTLANPRSGFQELVSSRPIRPDLLILIISVLNNVNDSEIHQLKLQILSETFTPEFIDEIKRYVGVICIEENRQRLASISIFFRNVLSLFETVINVFPSMMNEKMKSVMVALNLSMKNAKNELGIDLSARLFDELKNITDQVNSCIENKMKISKVQKHESGKETFAPNSFREIPLIPTIDDFVHDKAFLRQNIAKGSFKDVEQYLDIQFRLLREDFIAPLRTGIYEYIESLSTPHLKRRYTNVRIYPKVQFKNPFKSRDTFGFLIDFDCDKKMSRKINWEYNKRFMVGSLVLFSDNHFQTFYLATVMDRDLKNLDKNLLAVTFVPGTETPEYVFEPGVFFVMAESDVYYEAYRHVLSALQRMNEKNFPMKQYIVDVDTACFPPPYVVYKSVYKISGFDVNLLDEDSWPTPDQLKLNESQHRAFKSALTNDFVVIQGPPGTGKTFLALKIAEVLLKNLVSEETPIVVICYTNHALDQFLEGILKFTTNVIRIGSQSQNEAIDKYSIDKIRREKRLQKTLSLSNLYRDTIREKFVIQESLQDIEKKIDEINTPKGILNRSVLKSIIIPNHYDELEDVEVDWLLCLDSPDFSDREELMNIAATQNPSTEGQSQQNDIFQNATEFQEEEFEEIDDEENARRLADMVEDDFFNEDFMDTKHESIRVGYSLTIEHIEYEIWSINDNLNRCEYPAHSLPRFYLEQQSKERIEELLLQREIMNRQYTKFQDFKFDPVKYESLQSMASIWEISPKDRWHYYMTWIHLLNCQLKYTTQSLADKYQNVLQKMHELKQLDDVEYVLKAAVVGLTTSGAAKRRVLLENLNSKIVIVEEAAEVLEAHIVTSLTKNVQHVILIGDHKQLKPSPNVYQLAKRYNMDVSLFERMLNNGLGCSVLDVQHRMRPEIASLIAPTIYPTLTNHYSTYDRPRILGVDKFVFFLTHDNWEDEVPDSASRQNKFEADFLVSLCQYLLMQGYKPGEITILATYTGQVFYLRKEKRRLVSQGNVQWKDIRITPVDNFQGEENRIILLSLVRSNKEARIGFLSTENRVCVALSRAKEGLYIVGNMDNLTASSTIWPRIKIRLDEINAVGRQLTLRCERHTDQLTLVSHSKDFLAVSEGGCSLMCNTELNCGHVCPLKCHTLDRDHGFYKCMKPCNRPPCKVEGHKCPLKCWKACEPCTIPVEKKLPCGHSDKLRCHVEPASAFCHTLVPVTLSSCGHDVNKACSLSAEEFQCTHNCPFRLPCGHACIYKCHVKDDPDHIEYKCKKKCTKPNVGCRRNHPCPKPCYEQCGNCTVLVLTKLACGHSEQIPCFTNESDYRCNKPCTKLLPCGHKCKEKCWLICDQKKCTEKVDKKCAFGHTIKNIMCNKEVDSRKCMEPCTRSLPCGHPCSDKCFQECDKMSCQVLVKSSVAPACNHPPPQIPCHLNKPDLNGGSDELLQLCEAPCRAQLKCGHVCSGDCGNCLQGRIHVPCTERCNKELMCGHKCTAGCSELCPPCKVQKCFNNCSHAKCSGHLCSKGFNCETCKKPCVWSCQHCKCTKQCGELCNRSVCDMPCTFQLKCGHSCIGYCGEVHPTLCRVCDFDNPIISAHPRGRFVVLEDCNHLIESWHLYRLEADAKKGDAVNLMRCPEPDCRKPIVRTMRCRNVYIRLRSQVQEVSRLAHEEKNRLCKINNSHAELLLSSPTISNSMNILLKECGSALKRNSNDSFSLVLIGCLMLPLALRCEQLKMDGRVSYTRLFSPSHRHVLRSDEEQRLRLRLEYMARAMRLRFRKISYEDILQIELEVARILRALATHNLAHEWYVVEQYSWERDRTIMANQGLEPLSKFSSTLRTRDATKQWFTCEKKHMYVSENREPCVTCRDEENLKKNKTLEETALRHERLSAINHQSAREVVNRQVTNANHPRGGRRRNKNYRGPWQRR